MTLLLWVSLALAHRPGLSYAAISGDEIALTFAATELATRMPVDKLSEVRDMLAAATLDKVTVTEGGQPCEIGLPTLRRVSGGEPTPGAAASAGDGIELRAPLSCHAAGEEVYTVKFLSDFAPGHRHSVEAMGETVAVLDASNAVARFPGPPPQRNLALWVWLGAALALALGAAARWGRT